MKSSINPFTPDTITGGMNSQNQREKETAQMSKSPSTYSIAFQMRRVFLTISDGLLFSQQKQIEDPSSTSVPPPLHAAQRRGWAATVTLETAASVPVDGNVIKTLQAVGKPSRAVCGGRAVSCGRNSTAYYCLIRI